MLINGTADAYTPLEGKKMWNCPCRGRDGTIYGVRYILFGCAIIYHSFKDKMQEFGENLLLQS